MCIIVSSFESIRDLALSSFSYLWSNVLNSDFGIAATGSFFGAVGGYFIVLITNHRTEIFSKIDRLKVAIALTHSLFNLAYSLNKQHIDSLYQQYSKSRADFIAAKQSNQGGIIFRVPLNIQTISFPYLDFDLISSKLLRETEFSGRTFILATTLIRCLYELKELLQRRHIILNEINKITDEASFNTHDQACLYYGIAIQTSKGELLYTSYSDVIKAIKDFTLDCIWFSKELTLELFENSRVESKKIVYKRPKIGSVDYSDIDKRFLPDDCNYKDWREKFKKA